MQINPTNLMYVCPCIAYENDERYQLDATILFLIINNYTYFGHLYDHLQEYRFYTTAYGVCIRIGYKLTHNAQDYTPALQDLSHNT
jgi:hypothetical protein